jgi:NAD(P)-dependent dehydrogenase (short-subunit alcohol dehydrogenase family)
MNSKIAVVTGSSSGIGLRTTVEMARAGYYVVASMRDVGRRSRLDEALPAELKSRIDVRRLDVTEFDSIPGVVNDIVRDHGRIDVLVNNAGFAVGGFAEDVKLEELRKQLETNFFGHVAMTKAVLPVMRAQRSGHIIMLSSILGLIGQPVVSSYCASKFALEGWTEAARIEMGSLGVKLVLVEPGAFKTDIWDRNAVISQGALSPDSPNMERSRRFTDGVKKTQMGDAWEVARLIVRIAQHPNPKLRYRIGRDAAIGYWMRRILPWNTWEKMIAKRSSIH